MFFSMNLNYDIRLRLTQKLINRATIRTILRKTASSHILIPHTTDKPCSPPFSFYAHIQTEKYIKPKYINKQIRKCHPPSTTRYFNHKNVNIVQFLKEKNIQLIFEIIYRPICVPLSKQIRGMLKYPPNQGYQAPPYVLPAEHLDLILALVHLMFFDFSGARATVKYFPDGILVGAATPLECRFSYVINIYHINL